MLNYKKILWGNVSRLMVKHYGKENLTKCAADTGLGPGTMSRIKAQETSIGIDTLEVLGEFFKIEPYKLLIAEITDADITAIVNMLNKLESRDRVLIRGMIEGWIDKKFEPDKTLKERSNFDRRNGTR